MTASSKPQIYALMGKVMADIGAIGKTETNQAQRFNFRGIDNVYNALHSIMAEHGVFCTSEILDKQREERTTKNGGVMAFTTLRLRYHFHAPDGSSVSTEVEGEGMDSGDKSSNKAMAVGHKYALLQAFLIPTEEQKDPDSESPELAVETITEEQAMQIRAELERIGMSEADLCAKVRIEAVDSLEAKRFDGAIKFLRGLPDAKATAYAKEEAA